MTTTKTCKKAPKDTIGDFKQSFTVKAQNQMREEISSGVASMVNGANASL
ncbi:hypothetical protein O9929_17050 [Vibrio lentus]|nr:hypothetical protein [Vibrio lentus]